MPRTIEPFWPIVERHFEEAEFLAEVWRDALDEPDHTITSLAEDVEARLFAHLDGLLIAGAAAVDRLCWPALDNPDADTSVASSAGLVALDGATSPQAVVDRLLDCLDRCEWGDERSTGIVDALALSSRAEIVAVLLDQLDQLEHGDGPRLAGVITALDRRCVDPGRRLAPLLQRDDASVLAAAASLARHAASLPVDELVPLAEHANQAVAVAAIETGLLRGLTGAWPVARYWAFDAAQCSFRARALTWLGLGDDAGDHQRIIEAFPNPDALWAAGFCGRIAAVEAAQDLLDHPAVGALAGELVASIIGLDTDDEALWRSQPAPLLNDAELPSLAEDLDVSPLLLPEQLLPLPMAENMRAWWMQQRAHFDPGTRWLGGRALDDESLARALLEQPLRRRHALTLLARLRGRPLLATRDWAVKQLAQRAG
ncbi:hypothetical protein DB30_06613 [Enhygromyxa salina]|uniref:Uncharacterized protein n=1 Tax=Enhygromyxa salina TaxID=215803 RepID=A0A0C2DH44_9BACT|nr:hypothetical protein [Enhygromyxa salina]KIG19002.1 hypothetical protein DB30_06613 [Enhygromyxa salina]